MAKPITLDFSKPFAEQTPEAKAEINRLHKIAPEMVVIRQAQTAIVAAMTQLGWKVNRKSADLDGGQMLFVWPRSDDALQVHLMPLMRRR